MSVQFSNFALAEGLYLAVLLSAVPLIASLLTGLCVSVLQAATQIQEQTLSFVPKLIAVCLAILVFGAWGAGKLTEYSSLVFSGQAVESLISE